MKVLVADDSKVNLMLITLVLKEQGHEVVTVSSGDEAIAEYKHSRPDLIILDVMMEGMNGFDCARSIRALSQDDWIPIIFLSNSIDDANIANGIDAGGDDYLAKPFSKITLISKIKAMQRISDMRQKLYQATQDLKILTATDTLTGIYNRAQFDRSLAEKVSAADRHKRKMALLFIDLDNFKIINDSYGHAVGDLLLKEVSARLKSCLRADDIAARIGGDEFSIILSDLDHPNVAGHIAQKILDILLLDYHLNGKLVRISASIGIAIYPSHDTLYANIVQNADVAMYHAKERGRNSYQFYNAELNEKYKKHINLEQALHFALERNQLYLKYQPIFELTTKDIVGYETLICWDHPKFGSITPSAFIPIAEETGAIIPIGNWVLKQACTDISKGLFKESKRNKLAINISLCQVLEDEFYQNVVDILKETQVDPGCLEFEITETTPLDYASSSSGDMIKKFHDLGIRLSIDDFGTGYSSLTRLNELPIHTLKIDQRFIKDALHDASTGIIVKNLIQMCKELKIDVIAEGIETQEQLDFLIEQGCLKGQGYLLGKPVVMDL